MWMAPSNRCAGFVSGVAGCYQKRLMTERFGALSMLR